MQFHDALRLTEYAPGHSGREVAADAAGCAGYCLMMPDRRNT
ncbi:MAG: hypothetical protein ACLSB9_33340 [Hydrogeniiclostridium mannosilyticum]